MRFWVRVPVLSQQMHETAPRVSIDSRFCTYSLLAASRRDAKAREAAITRMRPSGMQATMIPMTKVKLVLES